MAHLKPTPGATAVPNEDTAGRQDSFSDAGEEVALRASHVRIEHVIKQTGEIVVAVGDVTLDIKKNEFVCIVGPSGCGKSTFLYSVAGLLPYMRGQLLLDGKTITGPGRDRGLVFQSASLLPWRTVVDNVAYGLELGGVKKSDRLERAESLLELVGLAGAGGRYPHQLSGGMQQRANLARALASDPALLLLDEPFAALDAQTREYMQMELLRIWQEYRKTLIFVTHQIDEAVFLADRVVVLSKGPASTVKAVVEISLPRPRGVGVKWEPRFNDYVREIWELIESEERPDRSAQNRLQSPTDEVPS
jgi:NitT/TauT family transport system ATP-binding protein